MWVTQLRTSSAVSLAGDGLRIEFEAGMPHDGRQVRDRLVFTTTNGHVVIVDPDSLEVLASHDLRRMTPGADVLGWCRGVCDDSRAPNRMWVAFSFPRESRWREYTFWLKYQHKRLPSRIVSYDVEAGSAVESIEVTPEQNLVLFQLDLLAEDLWV